MARSATRLFPLEDGADVTVEEGSSRMLVAADDRVRITTLHESSPTIVCSGEADVRIVCRDRSHPEVVVDGRASARLKALGASAPRLHATGSTNVLALARDTSTPDLEVVGAALLKLVVQDDADPRCHDWPAAWRARPSEVYVGQRLTCLATAVDAEAVARAYVAEWETCRNRLVTALRVGDAIPMLCADAVDVRWAGGTVHIELPEDPTCRPWLSHDAHDPLPFTEAGRAACTRVYL